MSSTKHFIDTSFKDFISGYSNEKSKECNLHLFIERHNKEIEKIKSNKEIKIANSKSDGFDKIVEEINGGIKYNCTSCSKIGDLIIAIISPKEMRLEHTDYSFDYIMAVLDKEHYRHPSETEIIKNR